MPARAAPRIRFDRPVHLEPVEGGIAWAARAEDLGSGGMFVRADAELRPGDRARVRFELQGGRPVEAEARVVRRERAPDGGPVGLALCFEAIDDDARQALEGAVEDAFARPRLRGLYEAARGLLSGEFEVPAGDRYDDEIGRLSATLRQVGARMASTGERLAQLSALTQRINDGVVLDDILNHVYEGFRSSLPYDRIGLALLDPAGRVVRTEWARSEAKALGIARGYAAPLAGTSLERILETRKPRILGDLRAYARLHPRSDSTRRIVAEGMRSSLTFPLFAMGRPTGFLFFSSFVEDAYGLEHVEHVTQVASQLAAVIEKGRLYEELLRTKEKLERSNRRLERLARRDALTGLANRREFDERFERTWRRARRDGALVGVLLADVDHFKAYNDRYGHPAGDDGLRRVGGVLAEAFRRPHDVVARYGGEEFVAIAGRTTREGFAGRARHVCEAIRALDIVHADAPRGVVTASVGVALAVPERGQDGRALLEAADVALYRAKAEGRDRVVVSA